MFLFLGFVCDLLHYFRDKIISIPVILVIML